MDLPDFTRETIDFTGEMWISPRETVDLTRENGSVMVIWYDIDKGERGYGDNER